MNTREATTWDLYDMPTDGSSAPVQLVPNAPAGRTAQGGSLVVSPDGTKVAFNANYAAAATSIWDVDVVPLPSGISSFVPLLLGAATQNAIGFAWGPQSNALLVLGDLRVDNQLEVFGLRDLVTGAQAPVLAQPSPVGGDAAQVGWTP